MEILTPAQKGVLEALSAFIKERGYTPSFRELAQAMGVKSLNTVHVHLNNLEKKGYVQRPRYRSRRIQVRSSAGGLSRAVRVPVLGAVAAGVPSLAVEEQEEYIEVDPSLVRGVACFALRVRGDSMKDAGILDGDVAVYRSERFAQNGDIVVARLEDEATVKYLRHTKDGVFLVPANDRYSWIPARNAEIIGVLTGVVRRYAGQRVK